MSCSAFLTSYRWVSIRSPDSTTRTGPRTRARSCASSRIPTWTRVTHPGNEHEFPLDLEAVVEAAAEHRVILELNDHSFALTSARAGSALREREFAVAARKAGAPIAIGSDAHFAYHVGRFDSALQVAEEIGCASDDFVNRDAQSVLAFLNAKRERPRLDAGGSWESSGRREGGLDGECASQVEPRCGSAQPPVS